MIPSSNPTVPTVPTIDSSNTTSTTNSPVHVSTTELPPVTSDEQPVNSATTHISSIDTPSSPTSDQNMSNTEPSSPDLPELLGRGHRQRQPSILLKNYVTNSAHKNIHTPLAPPDPSLGSSTMVSGNTLYPISNYIADNAYSPGH